MNTTSRAQRPDDERATPLYSEEDLARIDPAARRTPRPEDLAGTTAGSYRLVRVLGTGGLSSVWLGEHPVIGSRVAVKVLHAGVSECEEAVRRFVIEAQAVNRIQSPHVVRVFDFGKIADGRDYAVMELLEGETLGDRIARAGRLSWRELRPIAIQIARALLAAHRAGILHRDLKPDNIFLCGDREQPTVKVLDFGIAKLLDDGEPGRKGRRSTGPGVALGTPLYAAPEQAAGEALGPEADIYSLGVVLYEALAGRPPFCGSVAEVLSAKVSRLPPPLTTVAADAPGTVARLVDSMVAPTPLERPASVALVLDRLEQGVYEELAYAATSFALTPSLSPADLDAALPPEVDTVAIAGDDALYLPADATGAGSPAPGRSPGRRIAMAIALAIVAASATVAAALVLEARGAREDYQGSAAPSLVLPLPPASTPVAAPLPERSTSVRAAPEARPQPSLAPARSATPAASTPAARKVLLESQPSGALVKLQGRSLGTTPLKIVIDRRLRSLTLTVEKPGYRPVSQTVASLDRRLKVELTPEAWVDPFKQ